VVANHASYADSILLTAALPPCFGYVAKRELAATVMLGVMLKRLGTVFVERTDAAGAAEDTAVLERPCMRATRGSSIPRQRCRC
jgi:1-acyl-sn-glycerol-3-phosphate acyltransferase